MVTFTINWIQYCTYSPDGLLTNLTNFVFPIHVVLEGSVIRKDCGTKQLCRL